MIQADRLHPPPRTTRDDGGPRRLGVELEFAALSARDGALVVQRELGGTLIEDDPHRSRITSTSLGDFVCELDTQYAHPPKEAVAVDGGEASASRVKRRFQDELRTLFGDISSVVMPCEIVCPPLRLDRMPEIDGLVRALHEAGAQGTRASPFYGFGAQLNPEIAEGGTEWIVSVFKAYLMLSDWLRAVLKIDLTRRATAFANPFPKAYALMVTDPDYWPDQSRFIDDYLASNPVRNRELDLLPLLAWLDEDRVRAAVPDPRVKPRPTFHYRLPDSNFGQPDWSITLEWNRWCVVERLAENRVLLDRMAVAFHENRSQTLSKDWALPASEWLLIG